MDTSAIADVKLRALVSVFWSVTFVSRRRWASLRLLATAVAMLLTACGGGGGGTSPTNTDQQAKVARLEIVGDGPLITRRAGTTRLSVNAFDADGAAVSAGTLAWQSSDPTQVSVDSEGTATAQVDNGSADITVVAASGAIAVVTVSVAAPGPRTQLLPAGAIVGAPTTERDTGGEPTGRFTLALGPGAPAFDVGDILVGSTPSVMGRVVERRADGSVVLDMVDAGQAFPTLNVQSNGTYSNSQFVLADGLAEIMQMTDTGPGGLVLERRSVARGSSAARSGRRAALGVAQTVKCDAESAAEIKFEPNKLKFDFSRVGYRRASLEGGEKGIVVHGPMTLTLSFTVTANLAAGVTRKCSLLLGHLPLPASAPAWMLGGKVPIKVGFEVGAEAKGIQMKYELTRVMNVEFDLGYSCPAASPCDWVHKMSSSHDGTETRDISSALGRLGYKVNVFSSVGVEFSKELFGTDWYRFTLVQASAKLQFSSDTAPVAEQVADPAWSAKYEWSASTGVKTFLSIDDSKKAGFFLAKVIKLPDPLTSELELRLRTWSSPKLESMAAPGGFVPGQARKVHVSLDPASLTMPVGGSPVSGLALHLRRNDGSFDEVPVQFASAVPGQTVFDLEVLPTAEMIGGEFIAFAHVAPSYLTLGNEIELGSLAITAAQVEISSYPSAPTGLPGEAIDVQADVTWKGASAAPLGTVDFVDLGSGTVLCSAAATPVGAGATAAKCAVQFAVVGSHDIVARYRGSGAFSSAHAESRLFKLAIVENCVLSPPTPAFGNVQFECYEDVERKRAVLTETYYPNDVGGGRVTVRIIEWVSDTETRGRVASWSLDGLRVGKATSDFSGNARMEIRGVLEPGSQAQGTTPYSIFLSRREIAADGSGVEVWRGCGSLRNIPNTISSYNWKVTYTLLAGDYVQTTWEVMDVSQCPTPAEVTGLFPLEIGDSRLYRMLK